MADFDLPKDYDCIILGTGVPESILAAALARIGNKVLHLDKEESYSGDWATFHFKGIQEWIAKNQENNDRGLTIKEYNRAELLNENESSEKLKLSFPTITDICETSYIEKDHDTISEIVNDTTTSEVQAPSNRETPDADEKVTCETNESNNAPCETSGVSCEASNLTGDTSDVQNKSSNSVPVAIDADIINDNQIKKHVLSEKVTGTQRTSDPRWTLSELNKQWRKFNIDLIPKVLYSSGPMVDLLVSSDIAKYCEFKSITRVLTLREGTLETVPCSRADVFSSKRVSMIEKRIMMKTLQSIMQYQQQPEVYAGFEDKTFVEFLKSKKVTANILHYIQHSIAMVTDNATTLEGLKSASHFLHSLGRYGNTAFLWPLYGTGELPQCFCRMCAVFEGIYCLRRCASEVIVDEDNNCTGVIDSEGQRLNAKTLIMNYSFASSFLKSSTHKFISRAVLLTDKSLFEDNKNHISILSLPVQDSEHTITTLIELSHISMACPKDLYVVHLTCQGVHGPEADFKNHIENLFQRNDATLTSMSDAPSILWSLMYRVVDSSQVDRYAHSYKGVYVTSGPDNKLDFDHAIAQARELFEKICPGEEFIPKAPNPEDIIYDGGETAEQEQGVNPNTNSTAEVVEQDSETAEQEQEVNPNTNSTAEVVEDTVEQDSETVENLENENKTLTQSENNTPDLETSSTGNVPQ